MAKAVLSKDDADKIAVAFSPRKFPQTVTPAAASFVSYQAGREAGGHENSFRIDRIVAQQTGIADLERVSIEERVEKEALGRLKELQEDAYKQAYRLGLEEGREKAYLESSEDFRAKLSSLEHLVSSIENLKPELVNFNEAHIVRLTYVMAKKIAMAEIADRREIVLDVVKQAIDSAQSEESITVRVSPDDLQFIESMKEKLGKEFEKVKRAKFEASEGMTSGGCVVETNYGDVDATLEQRVDKLWNSLSTKIPKVKDSIG